MPAPVRTLPSPVAHRAEAGSRRWRAGVTTRRRPTRRWARRCAALVALALALVPMWGDAIDRPTAERELTVLTNADRTSNGLSSLRPSDTLLPIARARSEDMAVRNYFSHDIPPDGRHFEDLLDGAGVQFRQAGENIARNNYGDTEATRRAQTGFMNSPPHRANILEPGYREMAVGAWDRADGMKYYTVLFMVAMGDSAHTVGEGLLARLGPTATHASPPPGWLQALLGSARKAQAQAQAPTVTPGPDTSEVPDGASARRVQRGAPVEPAPPSSTPPATAEVVRGEPAALGLLDGIITRVLKLYLSI